MGMKEYILELEEMKKHVDVQLMINRQRHELLQKQSEALKETINVLKTMQNEKGKDDKTITFSEWAREIFEEE